MVEVRERIRISGQPLAKKLFIKYFWVTYNGLKEHLSPDDQPPFYFHFLTLMAFKVSLTIGVAIPCLSEFYYESGIVIVEKCLTNASICRKSLMINTAMFL